MREELHTAYFGLGSNLGDRAANLLRALLAISNAGLSMLAASSIYETDPVDRLDQPKFLNMVAAFRTTQSDPFSLLNFCLQAEQRLGRERTVPKGARTIDIDLLLLDDLAIDGVRGDTHLQLPHPRLHLRRFVLTPLAEVAPQLTHPVLGKTIYRLLDELDDSSPVRIYRE